MKFSNLILQNCVYREDMIEGGAINFSLMGDSLSIEYSGKRIFIDPKADVYLIHNGYNLDWRIISSDPAMDICHIIADYFFNSSVLSIIFHPVYGYENLTEFIQIHMGLYKLLV